MGIIKRPALVLYDEGDEDVMVARITTQTARSKSDIAFTDWKAAGLLAPSVVRLSKVTTIKKSLVDKLLGELTFTETQHVKNEWRALFA
jgi:mRNA interferase MazF